MKIEREDFEEITILRIFGDLDYSDLPVLENELQKVAGERRRYVFLNLKGCSSIVSSAVGLLVGWRCENVLADGEFAVVCPSGRVRSVLDALNLVQGLVRPEDSEEEVLAALRREPLD